MPRDTKPVWVEGCDDCQDLEQRWRETEADASARVDVRVLTARHKYADHRQQQVTA